jgi:hypothetical protein
MDTLTQKQDASKLLSMVDNVVLREQAYRRVRYAGAKASDREYGRLKTSINDLAVTAENFGKAGQP